MYLIRGAGGLLYLAGAIIMAWNIGKTIAGSKLREEKPMHDAAFDPAADKPLLAAQPV
jgi:cytochrome c oxidase cbb3-type subunit 1